ncbi:MAG TPA: hypothetical protein VFO15_18065 [Xanthobacteraceae bacterium]|nr:hypothetical protein [Xanthobacteraceae bacterium]
MSHHRWPPLTPWLALGAIVHTRPAGTADRYMVRPYADRDGVTWEVVDTHTHRVVAHYRVKANAIHEAHRRNVAEKGGNR